MPNFRDVRSEPTKDEWLAQFFAVFRLLGAPVTSWHKLAFQRFTVETESSLFEDLSKAFAEIARGVFVRLASDAWVDVAAKEVFDEVRKPATSTEGKAVFTATTGVGPVTKSAGEVWIASPDGKLRYTNTESFTVPLSGSSPPVAVRAEKTGEIYNVGVGGISELLTSIPGVTVSNPVYADGTWITSQGLDIERKEDLIQRCIDKWSTIGSGSQEASYRYWASSAANEVRRVKVTSPAPGSVRVIVAGASAPVSASALAAVAAVVEAKRPLGVPDVVTANAVVRLIDIIATLKVLPGRVPEVAKAKAQANVDAYARSQSIGAKVSREKVTAGLTIEDVDDIDCPAPLDTAIGEDEIFVPRFTLTTEYA